MNAKQIFPSKYIKAEDLKGHAVNVQISNIEIEEIGKQKDRRPVIYFRGKEKGMVLNKTNVNKICEILGTSETDEWFGGMIQLYPTEVEFQGALTLAIRVKAPSTGSALAGSGGGGSGGAFTKATPPKQPMREPGDDDVPQDDEDPFK